MRLETQRLHMTPLSELHTEALHRLCIEPGVRRYLFADRVISKAQVGDMIETSEACFAAKGSGFFALTLAMDSHPLNGEFAGFCGHRLFEDEQQMELLLGVSPQVWGAGLGGEAARAVLAHGFESCGFERVIAAADTPNQRSVRMLQKLGMSFRERRQWHGLDTMFYEITAVDFAAQS